jgi:5'-nucleotidase
LGEAVQKDFPKHICLNVNIPKINKTEFQGIKVCRQAHAYWKDSFDKRLDQFGKSYYWLTGEFANFDAGEDTDVWALKNGFASVVPVQFDMTAYNALPAINNWNL